MRRLKYPSARHALPSLLRAAYEGSIDADTMLRRSAPEWQRLAAIVWRAWQLPDAVEPEDITQEMMLEAVQALRRYDPNSGGMTLHGYVVWCAVARGKRFAQQQRNTSRRSCRADARFELSESRLGRNEARNEPAVSATRGTPADCFVLGVSKLRHHEGDAAIAAVLAAACDVDAAAIAVYRGGLARSETAARRMIREALQTIMTSEG